MEKLAIHGGAPVRDKKLYYGHQCIDEEDIKAVVNVLRGDYLTCGPKIAEIEARSPETVREYQDRLREKIEEFCKIKEIQYDNYVHY